VSRICTRGTLILATITAMIGVLVVAAPANAEPVAESSLSWSIEHWDGVSDPTTGFITEPDAHFQVLRDGSIHRINVTAGNTYWSISLAAPVGQELHPGIYPNAERAGFQSGRSPGLDVRRNGSGCNEVYGKFTIHQIAYDAAGVITTLEASFLRRCSPGDPAWRGDLKYLATPLSFQWKLSDDQPETPESHRYRGATSTFWASSFWTNSIRFGASGDRMQDVIELSPPAGERFEVGRTYRQAQPVGQQDPGRPGLSVDRFYCRPTTGNFTINELVYDTAGQPVALSVEFTLKCTEFPSPEEPNVLKGIIHFHA